MQTDLIYQQNPNFPYRYISPQKLFDYLQNNYSSALTQIGSSTLGHPIYMLSLGKGDIKVLAWSQMHGNESNASHAMLDMLESFKSSPALYDEVFNHLQLDFVFMLNPDGSEKWTRRNALDIDMNRDYNQLASKEFRILRKLAENGNYHYGMNLHEQRTLFSTDGTHPATLSFLAPSENIEREVTETRKKEMAVIAQISKVMSTYIPNQIARYNDEFYPNSTGDNFTKLGLPTILYEGGHYQEDYFRKQTRKYYTIAFYEGLKAMISLKSSTQGWEDYFLLPENKEDHFDIIYRNVKLNTDFNCVIDIAVQYKEEKLEDYDDITFVPMVVEVGDCGKKKGWREVDCTGKKFVSEALYPKLDEKQSFSID